MSTTWRTKAACIDMGDLFFPGDGREYRPQAEAAKAICQGCPVAVERLTAALEEEDALHALSRFGIRGGMGPDERANLARRGRRKAAKEATS